LLLLLSPFAFAFCFRLSPFAFGIRAGLQPSVQPAAKRRYRSAEGSSEARRTKRLIIPFVFFTYTNTQLFFCVFRPKNACQAPKPPNSLKQKKIELAR
jgi:hypothetical protein